MYPGGGGGHDRIITLSTALGTRRAPLPRHIKMAKAILLGGWHYILDRTDNRRLHLENNSLASFRARQTIIPVEIRNEKGIQRYTNSIDGENGL